VEIVIPQYQSIVLVDEHDHNREERANACCLCCQEYLLVMLHHHVAYGHSDDRCTQPHCLTHQMFAMNVAEQVTADYTL